MTEKVFGINGAVTRGMYSGGCIRKQGNTLI